MFGSGCKCGDIISGYLFLLGKKFQKKGNMEIVSRNVWARFEESHSIKTCDAIPCCEICDGSRCYEIIPFVLRNVLPVFTNFNLLLQPEAPSIHKVCRCINSL
ncbi:hypothetical protein PR048_014889 [Dryococelus australis]|uniref:Uncharacterized protein n=1 Tax=Dryococelus australis TaxID=614101 RepID=A0ABQ9HFE1_9NEOP|nr:hypothetical protein PR048_014889 [Dryococelus australis]